MRFPKVYTVQTSKIFQGLCPWNHLGGLQHGWQFSGYSQIFIFLLEAYSFPDLQIFWIFPCPCCLMNVGLSLGPWVFLHRVKVISSVFFECWKCHFQAFRGPKIQHFPGAVHLEPWGAYSAPDPQLKSEPASRPRWRHFVPSKLLSLSPQ